MTVAVSPCPQSDVDRRYFDRHEPTIPEWYAAFGKYQVRAFEPIEDEL